MQKENLTFATLLALFFIACSSSDNTDVTSFAWTEFNPSSDTVKIYVSTSGDDANDCLSEETACATPARGISLLRDGHPDWLLFKRGDRWYSTLTTTGFTFSGRSADEPMVIGSYGDSDARPEFFSGSSNGFTADFNDSDVSNLAIVGLRFKAHTRDPHSPDYSGIDGGVGIYLIAGTGHRDNILVEDCVVEYYQGGVIMHAGDDSMFANFKLRGSIIAYMWTAYGGDEHQGFSEGSYLDHIDGVLIEGNLFDHNGGFYNYPNDPNRPSDADLSLMNLTISQLTLTWFNHHIYLQSGNSNDVTVRNNIFAQADGIQMRSGGVAENNLFLRNVTGLSAGGANQPVSGGVSITVRNNAFVEGSDFPEESDTAGPRGFALNLTNTVADGLSVENNIFLNDISEAPYGHAVDIVGTPCGDDQVDCRVRSATVAGNVVYNWRGGLQFHGTFTEQIDQLNVHDNILQTPKDTTSPLIYFGNDILPSAMTFANNHYGISDVTSDHLFQWNNSNNALFPDWVSAAGETDATSDVIQFVDDTRTPYSYHQTLGGDGSFDALMTALHAQSHATWNEDLEAAKFVTYLQEGFASSN